jgi:hypothetical protein
MVRLRSSTITPTVAIGPPSPGSHAQVVEGDCVGSRGTALRKSRMAATSAPAMAVMLDAGGRAGRAAQRPHEGQQQEARERQPQHDQRQRGRAGAHRQPRSRSR